MARVSDIPTDVTTDPNAPAVGMTTSVRDSATSTECLNLVQPTNNDREKVEERCDEETESSLTSPPDRFDSYIERNGDGVGVLRQPSLKKMSRRLCFVLRWGAPSLHLPISSDGYVAVSDLQQLPEFRRYTEDVIRTIVKCDGKRRF